MEEPSKALLEIDNLTVEHSHGMGERGIGLRGVSFEIHEGEILVLAGESGSGRSLLGMQLVGLSGPGVKVLEGEIRFDGVNLLKARSRERRRLRRSEMAIIRRATHEQFNPDRTVRKWLREVVKMAGRSRELSDEKTWSDYFYRVGIVEPERILPLRMGELPSLTVQRLMLLRALLGKARLLICDDATADLDRIAEAQFIDLLSQIRSEENLAVLMTVGRLVGVDQFADRVGILYDGGLLEIGLVQEIFESPSFAYTREFLVCLPRITHTPKILPTISREAAREAEEAIHRQASPIDLSAAVD